MKVTCDIFRFDPDAGVDARYDTYLLDAEPTETVLDALIKIHRTLDPTLSFRFACGVVKCGECAITVNNGPCLACKKMVEAEMKIDPLPNLPIIKDIVVDRRKVFDRILKLSPRLSGAGKVRDRLISLDPQTIDRYVHLTKCFECLVCQSSCPVVADMADKFVGPLGLLWLAQMLLDRRNEADLQQDAKAALEMCERCGICSGVCPCSEDILMLALTILERG